MSCLCMLYCKMPSRGCSSHYCWWQAWCDVLPIAWNASYNSRLDTFALWVHMARLELPQIIACMLHKCMSTQLQATTHWLVLLKDTHAWDSNLHVSASWCAHWREGNWAPIQVSNISGLQRHVRWCIIQLCDCCVVFKAAKMKQTEDAALISASSCRSHNKSIDCLQAYSRQSLVDCLDHREWKIAICTQARLC